MILFFLSAKRRASIQRNLTWPLKTLALPPVMMLVFAALLAAQAEVNGLSGLEQASAFISDKGAPAANLMVSIALLWYLGAAIFAAIPSCYGMAPTSAGAVIARMGRAAAQWLFRAFTIWATPPSPASATLEDPGGPELRRPGVRESEPYSKGRHPQRE